MTTAEQIIDRIDPHRDDAETTVEPTLARHAAATRDAATIINDPHTSTNPSKGHEAADAPTERTEPAAAVQLALMAAPDATHRRSATPSSRPRTAQPDVAAELER